MKRKTTYTFLTILIIAGIYLGLRFVFGFFTPFNSWTAQQDIDNGKIQIVELGELPLNAAQKHNLANRYGFKLYYYGCNVSTDIQNGTDYYNKKMIGHLEHKYGIGWWTKFQHQLDSIDKTASERPEQATKNAESPINIIKNLFNSYTENQESTESQDNLDAMANSLKSLKTVTNPEDLELLINVWMYYDPTDFPTRNLVYDVLQSNRPKSIEAVKKRIHHKKDWEKEGSAPYSELNVLLKQLEK
ncbi:FEKKY domain-containing protein [Flavobacterium pedocola]